VKFAAIVALTALAGCSPYLVMDPRDDTKVVALCYRDSTNAFCRVEDVDHKTVTTGSGYLSSLGGIASLFALVAKP